MTREVVLDTETTGFEPSKGHRLVEIGCIELINHLPTGKVYHQYINPDRDVPADAFRVHGLSTEFLADYPQFPEIASDFLAFIGDSPLVIHNAAFDMKFLNHELKSYSFPEIAYDRAIDTVLIARKKFPGSPASLDALCKRFKIDNSSRTLHGALLDSELLAEVYLELLGGRQSDFGMHMMGAGATEGTQQTSQLVRALGPKEKRASRQFQLSPEELQEHELMVVGLKNSLWTQGN